MKMTVRVFAHVLEKLQRDTGLTLQARGGAYGASRLVIVDASGTEHDYAEAISGEGAEHVQDDESKG